MFGPKVTVGDKTLLFDSNGEVAVLNGDQGEVHGHWRSQVDAGAEKLNAFRYDLDGNEQDPLPAAYAFSDPDNQLTVVLTPTGGEASESFAFCGTIKVDDNHDVAYELIDTADAATGVTITVYGDLKFEAATENLVLTTTEQTTTVIHRVQGEKSLDALENEVDFQPKDLLRFQAETFNAFPDGTTIPKRAVIDFIGEWDLKDNQLIFASSIKGDLSQPAIHLVFAGQIGKAVSAGFEYHSGPDGTEVVLQLSGKHVSKFDSGTSTTTWEANLGYTEKKFTAELSGANVTDFDGGGKLTLNGDFKLTREDGNSAVDKVAVSLSAKYEFENNVIVFKADIGDEGGALSYNLELSGEWTYGDRKLVFALKVSNEDQHPSLSLELSLAATTQGDLVRLISITLNITEGEAELKLDVSFVIQLRWADGVPVKTITQGGGA